MYPLCSRHGALLGGVVSEELWARQCWDSLREDLNCLMLKEGIEQTDRELSVLHVLI